MKAAACAAIVVVAVALLGTTSAAAKVTDVGSWAKAPDMLSEHVGHTATLLQDGRVLIAGGTNLAGDATAECELFDPKTNRWTRAASLNFARALQTATLLGNGDVLVVGGVTSMSAFPVGSLASAEIYQTALNRWIKVPSAHFTRSRHSAVRLKDGRVLIAGGYISRDSSSEVPGAGRAEIYDPSAPRDPQHDPWSFAGDGLPRLSDFAITLMPDGTVLATGGADDSGFAWTLTELFDPRLNAWRPITWPLTTPRYAHTATLLPNGRVLLTGGYTTSRPYGSPYPHSALLLTPEILDLAGHIGVRVVSSKMPRFEHTATLLRDGLVLVVGSAYASNADSALVDPATGDWLSTGMPMDRYLHTGTLLSDGRVLIAGGYGIGSAKTAWIYSPASSVPAQTLGSLPLRIAALALLVVFSALGSLATLERVRWSKKRPRNDAEWIEP